MTSLVAAVRESISDRSLSGSEIDNLVEIAAREDGVSASELQQILSSFEQTDDGFTPAHRAQLWVRLTGLPTNPKQALKLLKNTPAVTTEGAHALTEMAIRYDMLGAELSAARSALLKATRDIERLANPEALAQGRLELEQPDQAPVEDEETGETMPQSPVAPDAEQVAHFEELKTVYQAAQQDALTASKRFFSATDIHPYDVLATMATFDYSARYRWDRLDQEIPDSAVVGMDGLAAARTQRPVPLMPTAPGEPNKNFARVDLKEATAWTYDWRQNTLDLPEGTEIQKLPKEGDLKIEGRGVTLPSGAVLDGTIRVTDGKMKLSYGQLSMNGLPVRASSEAEVRITKGFVVGGPNIEIPLPVMAMPEDPAPTPVVPAGEGEEPPAVPVLPKAETRKVRFTFEKSRLPDGTFVHRGSGHMKVIYRGEEAIGILEGSVSLKKGAVIVERAEGEEGLALRGHRGAEGKLESGSVYLQGDKVLGFGPSSKATIDGITITTSYKAKDMVGYKFSPPAVFQLADGAKVQDLTHRQAVISGENIELALGETNVKVESGGVIVRDGQVGGILAGSVVHMNGVKVTAGGDRVITVLQEHPGGWPDGDVLFVSKSLIEAGGANITIEGSGVGLLPVNEDGAVPTRASVELRGGKVRLERKREPVSPEYLDAQISGNATIVSGPFTYTAGTDTPTRTPEPATGPIVRITGHGRTHEIDPRPMWPTGETGELLGRFREIPFIQSPHLFAEGGVEAEVTQILRGTKVLEQGASGELVKRTQQALHFYLGNVAVDGTFAPAMVAAVERFQRLNGIAQTGKIDAATMKRLDAVAPPADKVGTTKPKVMVMVAMNGDVPDELRRFRELARLHGAEPVIIGPPDQEFTDSSNLEKFFQRAERGEIDFDWLVISGHSGGSSNWGSYGTLSYRDLKAWAKAYPAAAAQIEKLQLLNCYNVTVERANSYWPEMFPNIVGLAGFMYSAPGKKAQSSDENLLHAGRMLARIDKGEVPEKHTATSIGRRYASDNFIKWQNASVWVRYQNDDGTEDGHFDMTNSAKWEMRQHGASEELEVTAYRQAQIYQSYFDATEDEFAEPPAEHHSGPLREYLNAVDGVLGRWEARMLTLERYQRMRDDNPDFEMPEEFQSTYSWEREVREVNELRSGILFLIYSPDVRKFFDQRYSHTIVALNGILEQNGSAERFPHGDALRSMSRKETLEMLERLETAVDALPSDIRTTVIEDDAWRIMVGTDPEETKTVSPDDFMERAVEFLKYMKPDVIAAEWL